MLKDIWIYAQMVADRVVVGLCGHSHLVTTIPSHRVTFQEAYLAVLGPHHELRRALYLALAESMGKDFHESVVRAININNGWLPNTFEDLLKIELQLLVTDIVNEGLEVAKDRYKNGLARLSA